MPINLVAQVRGQLTAAELSALESLGNIVVKYARARAPVRKAKIGEPRRKMTGKPLGLSLAARQYVRSVERSGRMTKQQFQAFRYSVLHGRVQISRKARKRQPLILGKYGKDRALNPTNEQISTRRGKLVAVNRGHRVPYARQFRPARGVQAAVRFGKITPLGEFRAGLSGRAVSDIAAGRGVFTNIHGQLQFGGRLKDSIEVSDLSSKHVVIEADPADERGHHYARYVEFPTSRTAAQPFLLPALKDARRLVKREFDKALKENGLKG